MRSIFSPEGGLFRMTERLGNLVLLNWLYLIFCIPIITIGPASAALRYVTLKYVTNEEDRVLAPFLHSFRDNLKQGMAVGLLKLGIGIFLLLDLYYIWQIVGNGTIFNKVILVVVALCCVVYFMAGRYIYPLQARYENSIRLMLRTAAVLAIRHLPATVCMSIISFAPVLLLMYTLPSAMLALTFYFFIGFAAIAYLQDKFIVRIFWQYTPREPTEE